MLGKILIPCGIPVVLDEAPVFVFTRVTFFGLEL